MTEKRKDGEFMRVEAIQKLFSFRKKIHIRLDDDLHKKLRLKVAQEGTTIQNYITALLQKSLASEKVMPTEKTIPTE
jgi:predicted DNA binding CopG/RHH family protein